jgi:hypothetical protein
LIQNWQALDHGIEQQAHAFGDEGALEEQRRVLVFGGRAAVMHARQIGGKFDLLEGAAQDILMRHGDFTLGFEVHLSDP